MAFFVLFKNKNNFLFLYFIWLLLNLQMCQVILPDPVYQCNQIYQFFPGLSFVFLLKSSLNKVQCEIAMAVPNRRFARYRISARTSFPDIERCKIVPNNGNLATG